MEKKEFFKVEAGLLQAIANYLAARPFQEVAQIMQGLQVGPNCSKIEEAVEAVEVGSAQC